MCPADSLPLPKGANKQNIWIWKSTSSGFKNVSLFGDTVTKRELNPNEGVQVGPYATKLDPREKGSHIQPQGRTILRVQCSLMNLEGMNPAKYLDPYF